jgi:hypothetical protein
LRDDTIQGFELRPSLIDVHGRARKTGLWSRVSRGVFVTPPIWVLVVSHTSSKLESVDDLFVARQAGYIDLVAALLDIVSSKPLLLIVAFSKFDLLCADPDSDCARERKEALKVTFAEHIADLKEICEIHNVNFACEFCSSLKEWRTNEIWLRYKTALASVSSWGLFRVPLGRLWRSF